MMWNNYYWKIQSRLLGLTLQGEGGDNNLINLNSMSLNQAIALIQKSFNFQGTVDPTVNNNSAPQPDLNPVYNTGHATVGEEDERLQEVSQEFGKTDIKGPPINEKLTKIFEDLTYGIFKEKTLGKLLNDITSPENIEGLEVTKVNKEVWGKVPHKTKTFDIRFPHLQDLILKSLTVLSYMGNQFFENRLERDQAKIKENFKILKF